MKTLLHPNEGRPDTASLLLPIAVLALLACLFGTGHVFEGVGTKPIRVAGRADVE